MNRAIRINKSHERRSQPGERQGTRFARRWLQLVLMAAVISVVVAKSGRLTLAQSGLIDREYPLKAAFLYNFGKYIEWPEDAVPRAPGEPEVFVIGVVGRNPFGGAIAEIAAKKKLQGRSIVVLEIRSANEFKACHILFVPARQKGPLFDEVLRRARTSSVLIVGESEGFAQTTGMVNFFIVENKLRFEINLESANQAGLKISSKLLQIAEIIPTP